MKKICLLSYTVLTTILIACQPVGQSIGKSMLRPGDEIAGMIITRGSYDSAPLWVFCSPVQEHGYATPIDCRVPSLPRLAIGYTLGVADPTLQSLDWSALNWGFSLDGQPVDLKAFGIYDFVRPDLARSPSVTREIFKNVKAWDVIIINPTPGLHTLSGMAYDKADTYTWAVNFTVEESPVP